MAGELGGYLRTWREERYGKVARWPESRAWHHVERAGEKSEA
jgi:hypothetical protein